jgi:hypothetical protein
MMFRVLPPFGADPRGISEVVNGLMNGKSNNTGTVTLATGGALTTTLYDERISTDTKIILLPFSAAAYADQLPFGAFQDSTDQTAASTTAAYAVTLNTTDYSNGITVSNSSRVNFKNPGTYNIQFSLQFANADSQIQDVDIWFRKNGTDVAGSNSRYSIPNKHGSIDGHLIAALNYFIELAANDYMEIMWATTSTLVTLEQLPTQTSPTRPATPSAIVTANCVSMASIANVYVSSQTQGSATISHYANSTADKTFAYILVG